MPDLQSASANRIHSMMMMMMMMIISTAAMLLLPRKLVCGAMVVVVARRRLLLLLLPMTLMKVGAQKIKPKTTVAIKIGGLRCRR